MPLFKYLGMCVAVLSCSMCLTLTRHAKADTDYAEQKAAAEKSFKEDVAPFIKRYCLDCHQNRRPTEAGVNFSPALPKPQDAAFHEQWKKAIARVRAHDMPPDYADRLPKDEDREAFLKGVAQIKYLSPQDPGIFIIRRLTKVEYGNTLRDLFGVTSDVAADLPDEVSGAGYLNSLSPLQIEQYLAISEKVLDEVFPNGSLPPTERQLALFGRKLSKSSELSKTDVQQIAHSLAKKAFRRPPTSEEVETLTQVFELGRENNLSHPEALRLMVKAVLVSPQFLFITPASDGEPREKIVPLDDYQLASRLSYLLWASMPDDKLMKLADQVKLRDPEVLKSQVKRLLNDPRSRALFDGFGAQWLGIDRLKNQVFDPEVFPEMTSEMKWAMYDEARLFFESIVHENQSVIRFIDADYTYLNPTLASVYGLNDQVSGPEMQRVQLENPRRGGILGMPGVLAVTSFPNRTSPVKRGVWVLEQVLGDHVPAAPPDVPALESQDQKSVANLNLRERTELHRADPVCANCHRLLDPIGFGLENYDAIGRWRDQDEHGEAIDAAGELPDGRKFSNPTELKAMIASRVDELSRNLVEKLLAYGLCRSLEGYDEIVVDELMQEIADDEYRTQTLITAVVTSYPFTHRRVEEDRSKK
ncbi:DUF1592 domain-containing protein [Thalassoglobus neptunius]|uniref:DUF1592 domain-containing protein n=1 Tax=Thalassoglobus neptunius TaxID=1938619 RepID=UPI0018D26DEE|nr:DUF1592 domain-containing protein [Thalassoglobus neptunius]